MTAKDRAILLLVISWASFSVCLRPTIGPRVSTVNPGFLRGVTLKWTRNFVCENSFVSNHGKTAAPCVHNRRTFLASAKTNEKDVSISIQLITSTTPMSVAKEMVQVVNWAYQGKPGVQGWTDESAIMEGPKISLEGLVRLLLSSRDEQSSVLYAVVEHKVVGCIHVKMMEGCAEFGLFAVDPQIQSRGIGSNLLDGAEKHAMREWGAGRGRMKMIACRDDLHQWCLRRGYCATGATEALSDDSTDTPRLPIHFNVLERPLP